MARQVHTSQAPTEAKTAKPKGAPVAAKAAKASGGQGASTESISDESGALPPQQGPQGQPCQDPKKMQLIQRLAGMDEATLNAILNAATHSKTSQLGSTTTTAPADASLPAMAAPKVEEQEAEHSSDEDEEGEEVDEVFGKKAAPMKAMKSKKGVAAKEKKKRRAQRKQRSQGSRHQLRRPLCRRTRRVWTRSSRS